MHLIFSIRSDPGGPDTLFGHGVGQVVHIATIQIFNTVLHSTRANAKYNDPEAEILLYRAGSSCPINT